MSRTNFLFFFYEVRCSCESESATTQKRLHAAADGNKSVRLSALCHASRWERLPNKCAANWFQRKSFALKKQKARTVWHQAEQERERMREGWKQLLWKSLFSPLSCAPMEQNPYQIPGKCEKICNFLPLNMLAGALAAQLASHKQQWHNNDSNNHSNDNNDHNYDKNHNIATATEAVANFFLKGRA